MDMNRRHLIGAIRRRRRRRACDVARRRARGAASPPRSAATSRNMACAPAVPTIRPRNCNARSTKPRARKCRWRCRRASIAPACCALQSGTQLVGVRGATKLVFSGGASMLQGEGANSVGLTGITFDGGGIAAAGAARPGALPRRARRPHRRLRNHRPAAATASGWSRSPATSPAISSRKIATTAVVSFDALGLIVSRNTITDTNDNGIEILRTSIGDDGTLVLDNRIEDIKAGPGGSGQYGNAINAFRAGNVIVRGNRIRNCDYSAVRGNSASNIQHHGQQRQQCPRGRALFGIRVRGRRHRQQHRRWRRRRRLRLQFQRGRTHRRRAGQHHPQSAAEAADRHRARRRRRDRHLCRGGFIRDRQRDRERALVRHHRRLGQISPRRRHHGQRDPQRLRRRRRVGTCPAPARRWSTTT